MFSKVKISEATRKSLYMRIPQSIDSFMNVPYVNDVKKGNISIIGVPYDSTVTGRAGARFGPKIIRDYSKYLLPEINEDMVDLKNVVDLGDVPIIQGYPMESLLLVYENIAKILANDGIPFVFGGDHFITYAELKAYKEKYGRIAILHFDAHHDTSNTSIYYSHGATFRRAIEDKLLDTNHSVQIGMRGFNVTYRRKFAEENGMGIFEAKELHRADLSKIATEVINKIGDCPVLITIDIDFFDAAFVAGTGTPVANGFSVSEGIYLIANTLRYLNVKGVDIVEVANQKDNTQTTAVVANRVVLECIVSLGDKNEGNY